MGLLLAAAVMVRLLTGDTSAGAGAAGAAAGAADWLISAETLAGSRICLGQPDTGAAAAEHLLPGLAAW
jgi:hypothetical protein